MPKGKTDINQETRDLGLILLRTGSLLQSNGAHTARIRMTLDRIADFFGHEADAFITQRALTLTVTDPETGTSFSSVRRGSSPGVDFEIVSAISRMSWSIIEENWDLEKIDRRLDAIADMDRFPRWLILLLVGLAGASFCGILGGNLPAILVALLATTLGLFVRQEAHHRRFNSYLGVFFASLTATLTAGLFRHFFPEGGFEPAFAASVLFLIPGVPFINSFMDLLEGNVLNGILRAGNGFIISFMIALGLISSIAIFGF